MAYIGNALTALIYGANHRDDIVPDGATSTFILSQQVPGGYEENVLVFKRRYILDTLVTNTTLISINGPSETISCSNANLASSLSVLQPEIPSVFAGDNIILSGCSNPANNGSFPVTSVVYNGSTISITVNGNLETESGATITVVRGTLGFWEVLEPQSDYTIDDGPLGPNYHKRITFTSVPQLDDVIYVIHRGEATYNFSPTNNSVGPDQLQTNLRNFTCDRYVADGVEDTFALSLAAINSKALMVTVNGIQEDGDDTDQSFVGTWELNPAGTEITFHMPPDLNDKIRILNLGFSTISRRAALSPGQVGAIAPNSITATQLANSAVVSSKLAPSSVVTSKIADDNVTGAKILLNYQEFLRGKDNGGNARGLIKVDNADSTAINTHGDLRFQRQDVDIFRYDHAGLAIRPETDNAINLGTSTKRFKDLRLSGTATVETELSVIGVANVTGNITSTAGNVVGNNGNFTNVNTSTINGSPATEFSTPAGSIIMTGRATAPAGWILCDGAQISRTTFAGLFSAIGTAYGIGDGATTFNVPDLRQRFPLGKATSGTGSVLGSSGGSIDHTHIGASHTHDMSNHFHNIPGHYHGMGAGASLNITASGIHYTTLDHTHGTINTSAGTPHSHGLSLGTSVEPAHQHYVTHTHGVLTTGNQSNDHSHTINHDHAIVNTSNVSNNHYHTFVTDPAGTHSHNIPSRPSGPNTSDAYLTRGPVSGGGDLFASISTVGDHVHGGTTSVETSGHVHSVDLPVFTGSSGGQSSSHFHAIDIPIHTVLSDPGGAHGHAITGSINNESGHTHSINIGALGAVNSASAGEHSHTSSSFAGVIGNAASGNDGNGNFLSGAPSNNNTGAAGNSATSANNPPWVAVNFIIKA